LSLRNRASRQSPGGKHPVCPFAAARLTLCSKAGIQKPLNGRRIGVSDSGFGRSDEHLAAAGSNR